MAIWVSEYLWLAAYLWSCRRDYLDAEQWQQSSFVIGPRNDKDFVGHPSITPLISTPFLFPFLFPPFRHTVCLSLIIPPLRGGPNGITCWQLHAYEFHRSLFFFFFFLFSSRFSLFLLFPRSFLLFLGRNLFHPLSSPPTLSCKLFSWNDRSSTVVDQEVDRLRINAVNGTKIMVNDNGVHNAIVARLTSRFLFRYAKMISPRSLHFRSQVSSLFIRAAVSHRFLYIYNPLRFIPDSLYLLKHRAGKARDRRGKSKAGRIKLSTQKWSASFVNRKGNH